MKRRDFLAATLAMTALKSRGYSTLDKDTLLIGLTPVMLDDQTSFLNWWKTYLEARLHCPVNFVRRGSYREIVDLLHQNKIDVAWVCGYPYVRNRRYVRLLAVPLFNNSPTYQSYVIVPRSDTKTKSILDLRNRIYAFSDPDSNSGYLYPNYHLITLREHPQSFFSKSFFTWAHYKVIDAVGYRVADGGSIDSYVWETVARFNPGLAGRTRIVESSPKFGFPPIVARANLPWETFIKVQRTLVQMTNNEEGVKLLIRLNLTGFTPGNDELFDGIRRMAIVFGDYNYVTVP